MQPNNCSFYLIIFYLFLCGIVLFVVDVFEQSSNAHSFGESWAGTMGGNLFDMYFCYGLSEFWLTWLWEEKFEAMILQWTIPLSTQMNCDTHVRWKQAVFLWSNIVCSLIISFLGYEQNISHTLIPSQLQYIQMGRFLHAHTHTHTNRAVAKCWGLPLSLLPSVPNVFQRRLEIGASHTHTHT